VARRSVNLPLLNCLLTVSWAGGDWEGQGTASQTSRCRPGGQTRALCNKPKNEMATPDGSPRRVAFTTRGAEPSPTAKADSVSPPDHLLCPATSPVGWDSDFSSTCCKLLNGDLPAHRHLGQLNRCSPSRTFAIASHLQTREACATPYENCAIAARERAPRRLRMMPQVSLLCPSD
jgi:hypothetical protein